MKKLLILLILFPLLSFAQVPINRGGLKYETVLDSLGQSHETGRIVGVEVVIAPNPAISKAHVRTIELLSLIEEIDLEMIVNARVNYYDSLGTRSMAEVIDTDTTLSPDAKAMKKQLFASYVLTPKSTRNSYVDPSTGNLVAAATPGAVKEIVFYQNLTRTMLVAMGIVASGEYRQQFMRYSMIAYMLATIGTRAGI